MADQHPKPHEPSVTDGPSQAWRARRRALYVLAAFVVLSFLVHFVLGPTITAISPSWRYPNMPEQTISIFSVSRIERQRPESTPTPHPLPTPIIIKRAHMDLTLIQLREMVNGNVTGANRIRGANRTEQLEIKHFIKMRQRNASPASLAVIDAHKMEPVKRRMLSASADTGGSTEKLAGSIEWGDDNPPQVLTQASVADSAQPPHSVRIRVDIDPDGNVAAVTLLESSGDPAYDAAALDAARRTTYAPATLNGLPVHGTTIVQYPSITSST